jgi:hypothetical protein
MDILILIVISAAAAAFTSQLVGAIAERWLDPTILMGVLTAPLAAVSMWLLGGGSWQVILIGALAAGFLAAGAMKLLNRPLSVQQVMSRR